MVKWMERLLILAVLAGVLLAGVTAYAMGMSMGHGGAPMEAVPGNGQDSHENEDMMGGMGGSEEDHMPMMGYSGDYMGMHGECEEMMEEYWASHEESPSRDLVEVSGEIVGAEDYANVLEVSTEEGIVYAKLARVYVDTSTGYLVSGYWLFEEIEKSVDDVGGLKARIVGIEAHDAIIVLGIDVEGLGLYETPKLYDRNN